MLGTNCKEKNVLYFILFYVPQKNESLTVLEQKERVNYDRIII